MKWPSSSAATKNSSRNRPSEMMVEFDGKHSFDFAQTSLAMINAFSSGLTSPTELANEKIAFG